MCVESASAHAVPTCAVPVRNASAQAGAGRARKGYAQLAMAAMVRGEPAPVARAQMAARSGGGKSVSSRAFAIVVGSVTVVWRACRWRVLQKLCAVPRSRGGRRRAASGAASRSLVCCVLRVARQGWMATTAACDEANLRIATTAATSCYRERLGN